MPYDRDQVVMLKVNGGNVIRNFYVTECTCGQPMPLEVVVPFSMKGTTMACSRCGSFLHMEDLPLNPPRANVDNAGNLRIGRGRVTFHDGDQWRDLGNVTNFGMEAETMGDGIGRDVVLDFQNGVYTVNGEMVALGEILGENDGDTTT